jgi:hypothetical protein
VEVRALRNSHPSGKHHHAVTAKAHGKDIGWIESVLSNQNLGNVTPAQQASKIPMATFRRSA